MALTAARSIAFSFYSVKLPSWYWRYSENGKKQLIESYGIAAQKVHPLPFVPPRYIYNTEVPKDFDARFPLPKKYFFYLV